LASPAYLVLDYVEGADLAKLLQRGEIPRARAVDLVLEVADALRHAHEADIIHRDINLSNILVGERCGRAFVVDFGLAKCLAEEPSAFTKEGWVGATRHFAAPEQNPWFGGKVDTFSDVFALGVTLYYLLIGHVPQKEEPRIESSLMIIPGEPTLQAIVRKATRTDPADRYRTMQEFIAALEGYRRRARWLEMLGRMHHPAGEAWSALARPARSPMARRSAVALLFAGCAGVWLYPLFGHRPAKPYENTLGLEFVPLPGGKALISTRRVSRAAYAVFAAENPGLGTQWVNARLWPDTIPEETDPVAGVSWVEAAAFCDWLSRREQLNYRLPTTREWETAAGPGGATPWQEWTRPGTGRTGRAAWEQLRARAFPLLPAGAHPGAQEWEGWRAPNRLGVTEISLMGWEWCGDREGATGELRAARRGVSLQDGGAVFRSQSQPPDRISTERSGAADGTAEDAVYRGQTFTFRCVLDLGSKGVNRVEK
ncbi:MAG TPA: bifunctional serine/threonine-protein kinase/formylglycine-generating enzyme family protein, partial [Chthoniobacteraceae bacterium]|nr:bifunctional serine/threonine-protein kinase/formylglycine-generating enzyme family protein [Chthoniobacteraceae bacterium]